MNQIPFKLTTLSVKNGNINFSEDDLEKIRMIFIGTVIQHHYSKYKNINVSIKSIKFNEIESAGEFISKLNDNMKFFDYDFTLIDLFKMCNQLAVIAESENVEEL